MPSIAALIKELLTEDKYSSNFTDKIEDRVKELNVAQLQGIYSHLLSSAKASKTALWKGANEELMSRIQGELQIKTKIAQAEHKVVEEYRFQQKQKRDKLKMLKKEQIRVREMIEAKARTQAAQEVQEKEYQRQSDERMAIMRRVFEAEELRNTWWKRLALIYILFVAAIVVIISILMKLAIYFTICGIFFVTVLFAYFAYHCHQWTIIKPIKIAPEVIEAQIEQREDVLRKEAFSAIREKERKFQEQERLDKIDRKKRKKHKKEQILLQAKMLEQSRLERIAMAKEIIARSSQGGGSSIAGSASNSIQGSLVATIDPNKHRPSLTPLNEDDHRHIENMVIDLEGGSPNKEERPEVDDDDHDGEEKDFNEDDDEDEDDDGEDDGGEDEGSDAEHDPAEVHRIQQEAEDHMPSIAHHGSRRSGRADLDGKNPGEDDVISIFTSSIVDEGNAEFNKIYRNMYLEQDDQFLSPLPISPRPQNSLIAEDDDDIVMGFDIEQGKPPQVPGK